MTLEQLILVMLFHLKNFNDEGVAINEDTVHEKVLSDKDGFGQSTSKRIYKAVITWTLNKKKVPLKTWSPDWMELSVKELAIKLL